MTHRTLQHIIGSRAVASVSKLWADSGAAAEEVRNDYGEDLLVQTCLNGVVDSSRIWVQVKGRKGIAVPSGSRKRRISVPWGTAIRWANSADVVVVVLWDVNADTGWFAYARRQVNPYEILISHKSRVSLTFRAEDVFNSQGINRIAWESRISHANGRLVSVQESYRFARSRKVEEAAKAARNERAFILWDFLGKIGVYNDEGINLKYATVVQRIMQMLLERNPSMNLNNALIEAAAFVSLGEVHKLAECGLPNSLMLGLGEAAANMLVGHPERIPEFLANGYSPRSTVDRGPWTG